MNKQITIFSGCVVNNDKVLMAQRDEVECPEAHLKWELPGGKVDFGETPAEAVAREIWEETGRKVKVVKLLPYVQTVYWDYEWGKQQTLCFCYLRELIEDGKPQEKDHHIEKIEWIPIEKAKTLPSLPGVTEILELVTKEFVLTQ